MPAIHAAIPEVVAIDRRDMNMWEDDAARNAIVATGRRKLIFSGLLTEACVKLPAMNSRCIHPPSARAADPQSTNSNSDCTTHNCRAAQELHPRYLGIPTNCLCLAPQTEHRKPCDLLCSALARRTVNA